MTRLLPFLLLISCAAHPTPPPRFVHFSDYANRLGDRLDALYYREGEIEMVRGYSKNETAEEIDQRLTRLWEKHQPFSETWTRMQAAHKAYGERPGEESEKALQKAWCDVLKQVPSGIETEVIPGLACLH